MYRTYCSANLRNTSRTYFYLLSKASSFVIRLRAILQIRVIAGATAASANVATSTSLAAAATWCNWRWPAGLLPSPPLAPPGCGSPLAAVATRNIAQMKPLTAEWRIKMKIDVKYIRFHIFLDRNDQTCLGRVGRQRHLKLTRRN